MNLFCVFFAMEILDALSPLCADIGGGTCGQLEVWRDLLCG